MENSTVTSIGVLCAVIGAIIIALSATLAQGIVGVALIFLSWYFLKISRRNKNFTLPGKRAILLMKDSKIFQENLSKVNLTEKDLRMKIQKLNLPAENKILAVVWERTGELSVLHSDKETEVDEQILEGVER
ncbi:MULTISPECIES: YetF domain-containing protein [Antarcticibacterium]|nr:YetF domain-containing protein [Antarcticibacterium sp. W02-3]